MADMSPSIVSNPASTPTSAAEVRGPSQNPIAGSTGEAAIPPSLRSGPSKKRKISSKDRDPSLSVEQTSDGEGGSTVNAQQRESKRVRVHFSCVACHRRKTKCDRKEPCSQCVARRVPHQCRPFINGVEDPTS